MGSVGFGPASTGEVAMSIPTPGVLGSNTWRGSFGPSFIAIERAPIDLPPLALSCEICATRSISSRPTMSSRESMICSLRDLSADRLFVTRDATSEFCSSPEPVVRDPAGCESTGVVDWLRRSSSIWSGAGGDIS